MQKLGGLNQSAQGTCNIKLDILKKTDVYMHVSATKLQRKWVKLTIV